MSGQRSKNPNKKSDNKQINFKSIHTDYSTNLAESKEKDTTGTESSNSTIQNDHIWQILKSQKQPSKVKETNHPPLRQLPKFFRLHSSLTSLTKKQEQQTTSTIASDTSMGWEQILDREFQSLDIDADGYVSTADLQSVLKNFSHIYNSNEIMLRIFEELDLNHDQRISKHEFKLYKKVLLDRVKHFNRSTFEEKLGSTFAIFDRDHDNYITPYEIRETMRNLGENIDDNLIEEMMETADMDHDGRISRDEFKNLLIQLYSKT